ncbi:MAG: nucleotidyl transferase AbiEii/AbiGii toxin family protein [candidate division NC10 bacterium]|nr:nucleotidyl transferase AbiEii/AbiGii toxin family protein [candidate division NC10 bacterium]
MPGPVTLEEILSKVLDLLDKTGIRAALIGGLAVATWGSPRATEDIDLLAELAQSPELEGAIRADGWHVSWRRGGSDDPIPLLLRLEWIRGGPEIDVICATRPWERAILDRAVQVTLPGGRRVPVVTPEDLIVLKLLAGGPQDLIDVTDLLTRCGTMPELDERATERGVVDLLQRVRETIRLDRRGLTDS